MEPVLALESLVESLDADILDPESLEYAESELRALGCDVPRLVAKCRAVVERLLAARRARWEAEAHQRMTDRAMVELAERR